MNMVLKFILNVLLLATCFLLSGTASLADPCPSDVDDNRVPVVTMCTSDSAEENYTDGSINVDSVALRILEQHSGCVCDITVLFQVTSPTVFYLKSYNNLTTLDPTNVSCGLEIDVENVTSSESVGETLDPITCLTGNNNRLFTAPDKQTFKLTLRKTNDTVMNGYCLQIYRVNTATTPETLRIQCSTPETSKSTKANSNYYKTTSLHISTGDKMISIDENLETEELSSRSQQTTSYKMFFPLQVERNNSVIIGLSIVAAVGWIFFTILLVYVICNRSRIKTQKSEQTGNNSQFNYEIPSERRELSNYSTLNQVQTEQQYEAIYSSTR